MWLSTIHLKNCRIVENASLSLSPYLNIITGDNGSGKSTFLEALSILSRGRSHRTSRIAELITYHQDSLIVSAKIHTKQATDSFPIGIEKSRSNSKIRINHQDIHSQAELSQYLPVTLIHPESVNLITGGPIGRRAFIDWIAFYRYPDFHILWKQYQRILKQRNSALRDPKQHYSIPYWTDELIKLQAPLHDYRNQAIQHLNEQIQYFHKKLMPDHSLTIELTNGLPSDISLDEASLKAFFDTKLDSDIRLKKTSYGAHRADLHIHMNSTLASKTASRGQLKLIAIILLLAQSSSISDEHYDKGIIAIDDLAAELDESNRKKLFQLLKDTQQQLIITNTKAEFFDFGKDQEIKMFHVKHGKFETQN